MAVFVYTASNGRAGVLTGTLIADSPRQARDRLRDQGLNIYRLDTQNDSAERGRRGGAAWLARLRRPPATAELLRELSTLTEVGVPVLEALDTLAEQQRGRAHAVVLDLRDRIAAGSSLAQAMRESRHRGRPVFDEVTVAMTEVGEDAGRLGPVLDQVSEFHEKSAQLRNRLGGALIYPTVVLAVGVGVSIFLMTYVVPGLLDALSEAGQQLPWITRLVKGGSDVLLGWGWLVAIAGVLLAAGAAVTLRHPRGRRTLDRAVLRTPLLGDIARKQAVVRIAFVVATLMRSGVAFERAILIAQRSTRNTVLRDALRQCEEAVHAGRDLGPALAEGGAFGATVVQVFALGQASGRLEDMLERLAAGYDRQVALLTTRLTALLEPVLILLLAVVVGAIAFATILPILEIGQTL